MQPGKHCLFIFTQAFSMHIKPNIPSANMMTELSLQLEYN